MLWENIDCLVASRPFKTASPRRSYVVDFELQGGKQVACLLSFPKQPPAADAPHGARQPDKPAIPCYGWDITPGRACPYRASATERIYGTGGDGCHPRDYS